MADRSVLVLGSRGRLGRAAVLAFAAAGWNVVAQARRPSSEGFAGGVKETILPLEDVDGIVAAARGASVVVYGVNPLYTDWTAQMMPLARSGFAIARRLGALFMLPGNVYGYGEGMPAVLGPETPERPTTTKGRQRVELEAEMAADPALRSIVVRAGDFYGAGTGSWLDQAIVKSIAKGKLVYPGPLDRPHAWAYLPDLARALVALAERDDGVAKTRRVGFAGHTLTGRELLDVIEGAASDLGLHPSAGFRVGGFPWPILRIAGLFVPMWRELASMSYLWRVSHRLDGAALQQIAPDLATTPPRDAMRETLVALGFGRAVGSRESAVPA